MNNEEDYVYSSAKDYAGEKGLLEIEKIEWKKMLRFCARVKRYKRSPVVEKSNMGWHKYIFLILLFFYFEIYFNVGFIELRTKSPLPILEGGFLVLKNNRIIFAVPTSWI